MSELTTVSPPLLSDALQERARRYVAARRRSGEALLEAVAELAAARQEAAHGAWGVFLAAIGLDDSAARAQLRIHELASQDPAYAERIRTGFLTEATAREVLALPAETRAALLAREEPPSRADVRAAKREPAPVLPDPPREHPAFNGGTPRDLLDAGIQIVPLAGDAWQAVGFSGPANGWVGVRMDTPEEAVDLARAHLIAQRHIEAAQHADPDAVLLAAGWTGHATDPLAWRAPGRDADGRVTEITWTDAAELAAAAQIVAAEPGISGDALVARLTAPAAAPAATPDTVRVAVARADGSPAPVAPVELPVLARVGALAVHASADGAPGPYTVTHARTGRALVYATTADLARQAADELAALNWDFANAAQLPAATRDAARAILVRYYADPDGRRVISRAPAAPAPRRSDVELSARLADSSMRRGCTRPAARSARRRAAWRSQSRARWWTAICFGR